MTFHDQMTIEKWSKSTRFEQLASHYLFTSEHSYWVAVSEQVKKQLVTLGTPSGRVSVIPAYIAPLAELGGQVKLPDVLTAFISEHTPIISTYGWKLAFDQQGIDLYGFDLCLEMTHQLVDQFPTLGLVICIPQINDVAYLERLRRRAIEDNIQDHVLFLTQPMDEAYRLWQMSDVYIRATTTDGDALAVREALSFGSPVVASDASERPSGVVLFKNPRYLFPNGQRAECACS